MTAQTRATLYNYFLTNSKPTQAQFADLVDSNLNLATTSGQSIAADVSAQGTFSVVKTLVVSGNTNLYANLIVNSSASANFTGNVSVGGSFSVSGSFNPSSVSAQNINVVNTLVVSGATTLGGNLSVNSSANTAMTGNLSVTGPSTFTGGIIGVTASSNAVAGRLGEYKNSNVTSGSAIALTTGTGANVTSISLTAGDWDLWGQISFIGNSATTVNYIAGALDTISAQSPINSAVNNTVIYVGGGTVFTTVAIVSYSIAKVRVTLDATTTYYLTAQAGFGTSTISAWGFIAARRVR